MGKGGGFIFLPWHLLFLLTFSFYFLFLNYHFPQSSLSFTAFLSWDIFFHQTIWTCMLMDWMGLSWFLFFDAVCSSQVLTGIDLTVRNEHPSASSRLWGCTASIFTAQCRQRLQPTLGYSYIQGIGLYHWTSLRLCLCVHRTVTWLKRIGTWVGKELSWCSYCKKLSYEREKYEVMKKHLP